MAADDKKNIIATPSEVFRNFITYRTPTDGDKTIIVSDHTTFADLQDKIFEQTGVPADQQRLLHEGKPIVADKSTLVLGIPAIIESRKEGPLQLMPKRTPTMAPPQTPVSAPPPTPSSSATPTSAANTETKGRSMFFGPQISSEQLADLRAQKQPSIADYVVADFQTLRTLHGPLAHLIVEATKHVRARTFGEIDVAVYWNGLTVDKRSDLLTPALLRRSGIEIAPVSAATPAPPHLPRPPR